MRYRRLNDDVKGVNATAAFGLADSPVSAIFNLGNRPGVQELCRGHSWPAILRAVWIRLAPQSWRDARAL